MTQLPDLPPTTPPPYERLQAYLLRALASLLVSLVGLIGWHLSEQTHARLPLASQTSPALPELRPVSPSPVSFAGVGGSTEAVLPVPARRFQQGTRLIVVSLGSRPLDLTVLGRMNLDGG